jgi:hypothetical protein
LPSVTRGPSALVTRLLNLAARLAG